jgi:hypothetical protein
VYIALLYQSSLSCSPIFSLSPWDSNVRRVRGVERRDLILQGGRL